MLHMGLAGGGGDLLFLRQFLLYRLGWPRTQSGAQDGLELIEISLPLSPSHWDERYVPPK